MRKSHSSLDSFLISTILHIFILVFLASYITVFDKPPDSSMSVTWVEAPEPTLSVARPLLDESLLKKFNVQRKTGVTSRANDDFKSSDFAQTVAPSPEVIRKSVELNPRGINTKILPNVTTDANINPVGDVKFSDSVNTARGVQTGKGVVTGRTRADGKDGKGGLSIIERSMAQDVGVSADELKSPKKLPEDKLGGMLTGEGNDISGHIRLIRVKHGLSDWWQDPTALTGLVDWLNKNTRIKADMKVAGGVLELDDPRIFEAPLIIMTGHDRSVTLQNNLIQPERNTGGKLVDSLTSAEKAGLREYLIDRGGMLFFDDCGFNGLFANEMRNILRQVLPEYNIENIPRTHEIFNCYYNLPGPPRGSEMFWGSENEGKSPIFPYLQGISIGRRLAVIFSRKDYLCAIETVEIPSHTQLRYRYSPDVYKFMSNVVVYALKYGGITDRSDYN